MCSTTVIMSACCVMHARCRIGLSSDVLRMIVEDKQLVSHLHLSVINI